MDDDMMPNRVADVRCLLQVSSEDNIFENCIRAGYDAAYCIPSKSGVEYVELQIE